MQGIHGISQRMGRDLWVLQWNAFFITLLDIMANEACLEHPGSCRQRRNLFTSSKRDLGSGRVVAAHNAQPGGRASRFFQTERDRVCEKEDCYHPSHARSTIPRLFSRHTTRKRVKPETAGTRGWCASSSWLHGATRRG